MDTAVQLFTRRQVSDLTGIHDDVLNYWMREAVLRPREGGEGRGQHRRFDYPEVTLAAVLDQLRGFGLGLPALKRLATRFHEARDYMDRFGITRRNYDPIDSLLLLKREVRDDGTVEVYLPDASELPELERHHSEIPGGPRQYVALPFEEVVGLPQTWGRHIKENRDEIVAWAQRIVWEIDYDEYRSNWRYWSLLTLIVTREPDATGEHYTSTPDFFYRDTAGDWHLAIDDSHAGRASIAFIGVNVERLSWQLWHGNTALHA